MGQPIVNKSLKSLQQQVDAWNANYAPGQAVNLVKDDGSIFPTRASSPARVLGGHSAVIWVDGIAGCYALERVTVRQ